MSYCTADEINEMFVFYDRKPVKSPVEVKMTTSQAMPSIKHLKYIPQGHKAKKRLVVVDRTILTATKPMVKPIKVKKGIPLAVSKALRTAIIDRDRKCQKCGAEQGPLCVHHVDWNHANDEYGNLILLCRSCHSGLLKQLWKVKSGKPSAQSGTKQGQICA